MNVRLCLGVFYATACAVSVPSAASAFSPYLVVPDPRVAEASAAYRYANMSNAEALAELDRRKIPYTVATAAGVRAPIRLAGQLHGVSVHASIPAAEQWTSPFEILDARLALSLDDFCSLLAERGFDELVHFTMYRPNVAPTGAPRATDPSAGHRKDDRAPARPRAARARRGDVKTIRKPHTSAKREVTAAPHAGAWAPPGTRHPAGLAIDVARLHRRVGGWLTVQSDFHGRLGAQTCGAGAAIPEAPEARELRDIVCGAGARGIFTYALTPNYDLPHADHVHMEIKPGVRWFLYN